MTRTIHSYHQKQLNEAHQKQLLKRNEKTSKIHRFDHISSALRDRRSSLFEFSTLAEFFIAKSDTNRKHKRNFKIKNTRSADHIEDLKRTYIEGIRYTRETPGGQGGNWGKKRTTGGAYPALTRRKMIQEIKKW